MRRRPGWDVEYTFSVPLPKDKITRYCGLHVSEVASPDVLYGAASLAVDRGFLLAMSAGLAIIALMFPSTVSIKVRRDA